jgi:Zn finger protein HypA/HybF involved in hydrogenase expression
MHELSLMAALIDECRRRAGGRAIANVRVRLGPTLSEEEAHQVFAMLTADTTLEGAVLEVEPLDTALSCVCGYSGPVDDDHIVGHLLVCQHCGRVYPSEASGLELLTMSFGE